MITIYDTSDTRFRSESIISSASLTNESVNNNTFFELLPIIESAPIITNDIALSFHQFTYDQKVDHSNRHFQMVEGTSFQFQVIATDPSFYKDELRYVWKRDGNTVLDGVGYDYSILYYTSSESVKSISGIYHCEVSNRYGTSTSDSITLTVHKLSSVRQLNSNLVTNPNAAQGVSNWDIINDDFCVYPYHPAEYKWIKNWITNQQSINLNPNFTFFDGRVFTSASSNYRLVEINALPNDINQSNGIYTNFFPSPIQIDNLNNTKLHKQIINSSSLYYFGRKELTYSTEGGNRICAAKQTISITDLTDFIKGNVYGINQLSVVATAYIGGGISYYDSIHPLGKVEDYTTVYFDFYDINEELIPSPYGMDSSRPDYVVGPNPCEIYDLTTNKLSFKGCSVIMYRRTFLPYIPANAAYISVRIEFEHKGIQQELHNPSEYNWESSFVHKDGNALGATILTTDEKRVEQIYRSLRYGNPRSLVTGLQLVIFPNSDGKNKYLSSLIAASSTQSQTQQLINNIITD